MATPSNDDSAQADDIIISSYDSRRCFFATEPRLVETSTSPLPRPQSPIARLTRRVHTLLTRHRKKVFQRQWGHLSLIASISTVQYGRWHTSPACLIAFRFQFQDAGSRWRFENAEITITFDSTPQAAQNVKRRWTSGLNCSSTPDSTAEIDTDDPAIVDYGPKRLVAADATGEKRDWHFSTSLSAKASLGPVRVGPSVEAGGSGTYERRFSAVVEADDFGDAAHQAPNAVKYWLKEDPRQKEGVPLDFLAAVVVTYEDAPFQATVEVQAGTLFDALVMPWSRNDPVLFQPNVGFGEGVVREQGNVIRVLDFATLTAGEWRGLVTPELDIRQEVHSPVL